MTNGYQHSGGGSGTLLSSVRVLDLTSVIMGPYATQILGDLGADVITVESAAGELNRVMSAGPHPHLSGIALNILRNKRNVALDLKDPVGRRALLAIAATCDVVVTNLRPKSLEGLGLTYADIAAVSPDIVFCQAQGFPSDGPYANAAAYDDIIQSASGVAAAFEMVTGTPGLAPTIMADKVCGLTIVYAVLAALLYRSHGGGGQRIEVPMVDAMSAFMLVEHGAAAISGSGDAAPGYRRILTPNRRPQRTADGWIHILPYTAEHYAVIFEQGGRHELVGDPRCADLPACIANSDFLYQTVQSLAPTHTTGEWLAVCAQSGIPATHIASLEQLVEQLPEIHHPIAGPYKTIPQPIRFSRSVTGLRRSAPLIGEHTAEVLEEVGFPATDIEKILSPQPPAAMARNSTSDREG